MLQSARIVNIERIASVDEREEKMIALGDFEQAVNEQARAGAQIRTDDFRDCAFVQTALERLLKQGNVDLSARESWRLLKAFCEKFAEIDDALGRRHVSAWHAMLICSSEQFFLLGSAGCQPAIFGSLPKNDPQSTIILKIASGKLPDAAG